MIEVQELRDCLMKILMTCEQGKSEVKQVMIDVCDVMEEYKELIRCCPEQVSRTEYQDLYRSFYVVGRMTAAMSDKSSSVWGGYFDLLREQKLSKRPFKEVLEDVCCLTRRREKVFCTKLMATADPHEPVIDRNVCDALKIDEKELLRDWPNGCCQVYDAVRTLYRNFLASEDSAAWIKKFDAIFPSLSGLTPEKKIDVLLWQKQALLMGLVGKKRISRHGARLVALRNLKGE